MFKKKSHFIFYTILVLFTLVISGCSSTSNKSAENKIRNEEVDGNTNKKTKIVKTVHGDIEIPLDAKRIVVDAYLPTLLLLDKKPVGAAEWDIENVHIQDLIEGIESTGEGDPETILSLNPDLIISADAEKSTFEKLSKIAPTVIIPYETYKDVYEEVNGLAEILGKEKEAKEWLKTFDEDMEKQRARIENVINEDETVSIFGLYEKSAYIYGDGIYRGGQAIYKQLKLTPADRIKKELMDVGETKKQVSFEVFNEYAGDYIFLEESSGGKLDKTDAVWNSIDAVKNDHVFYLDSDFFWPYDPIAVKAQAEEIANMLIEKKKGN
ncbi:MULTISPECIES: ABC transporter substrate-binding protein [Lysinibacillus]|uniref:ABC transporter substrate-binding protein n=1 Tax=Lysinibacillus xylanilyticus TaxID=582475 RepID=A0ABV3VSU7_9BACI